MEPLAGYLSLHQSATGMSLKWTPNQLMKGGTVDEDDANASVDRRLVAAADMFCLQINQSINFQGGLSNKQLPQGPRKEKKLI